MAGDDAEGDELDDVPDVTSDDTSTDKLAPFFIVFSGPGERKLFKSAQKNGVDYIAKIKTGAKSKNSLFTFDKRTKTVRLVSERNIALGNKSGKGNKRGNNVVFRRVLNSKPTSDQADMLVTKSAAKHKKLCIELDGKNADNASLIWSPCNGKTKQKFLKEEKNKDKSKPDFTKTRFQIVLGAKGKRKVYLSKEKSGDDFVLKISKEDKGWRSWFVMDKSRERVLLYTQPHLSLSVKAGKGVKPGQALVMRKVDKEDTSQPILVKGSKIENKKSKRCLAPLNNENKDEIYINFWPCISGKETQKWNRVAVKGDYDELCTEFLNKKEGMRYKKCPGKKDVKLGEHCIRTVIQKHGKDILVKQCGKDGKKQYEIAKCKTYQEKGEWYQECGKSHLKKLKKAPKQEA